MPHHDQPRASAFRPQLSIPDSSSLFIPETEETPLRMDSPSSYLHHDLREHQLEATFTSNIVRSRPSQGSTPGSPEQFENCLSTQYNSTSPSSAMFSSTVSEATVDSPSEKQGRFYNHGHGLDPSRFSGVDVPWGTNKVPETVPQDAVSDAALLKRGLKRGKGPRVIKRGAGANDPENIAIVNMKENEGLSFAKIAEILNQRRVEEGRQPSLTQTGVNGRYNRTAPLLFAAEGKEFVPLSQRSKDKQGAERFRPMWNDELNTELVKVVKEAEAQKWEVVARMFEERTGLKVDAKTAARQYSNL
ncbi:hypothetical protein F5884DRAFT_754350 [Xylogone sp. PMI_703]|nr:hypothetical protein F5884DRAFT_754350 [Xylogone sp. PMI_703]